MNPNAYTGGNHQSLLPHEHIPKKKMSENTKLLCFARYKNHAFIIFCTGLKITIRKTT